MKKILLLFVCLPFYAISQNSLTAIIKNADTKERLQGITLQIKNQKSVAISDSAGVIAVKNIPDGKQDIQITGSGFEEREVSFRFPLLRSDSVEIFLQPESVDLNMVIVNSTRSYRGFNHTPTRVEIIDEEEIREEAAMRPGDVRMLLSESTGVQAQQTSATSANASIRIQGLDGRYTQVLKDGFPLYPGAATGLGLLQTPPLDLRQVEIIKGASSTLYGGGAIAGLINLISKIPGEKRELNLNFNITSAGGYDVNGFYSKRSKKTGITLFAARNSNKAFDPASIGFSAIPKFERYTVNPKFFFYFNDKLQANFGINTSFENRLGGDMLYIKGKGDSTHSYFERNKTRRVSSQFSLSYKIDSNNTVSIKNSLGYFNRVIGSKGYDFDGTQYSSFTEATWVSNHKRSDWVAGINILTDHFTEKQMTPVPLRNYDQNTAGIFLQNTLNINPWLTMETGLRADKVNGYEFVFLPRVSALFKIASNLTSRIGGGFGYKPPTIFTEESEKLLYKNVLPVDAAVNKLERSYGANWDINYRKKINEFSFSINQFFFYTYLKNPLFLTTQPGGVYILENIPGHIYSRGAETNIKIAYNDIALYLGYTYTDARVANNGVDYQHPLTPKHRFNAALVYEIEKKWKIGSELYYFSSQQLSDGSTGRGYWLSGLVAERLWKKFSLYINFENFGDTRQTKFESIYTGTITNPGFKDIYAPLEGFVVNGGIKIKL